MQEFNVKNFNNETVGSVALNPSLFQCPLRSDLLARVVSWQRAKLRSGNHKTKGRSEVSRTGRKPYRQKGTGRARLGSYSVPQCRGGGVVFGPVVRSHAFDLPKKVRLQALCVALSLKLSQNSLIVVDKLSVDSGRTKVFSGKLKKLGLSSVLFVGGDALDKSFVQASRNVPNVQVLPQQGINVYDILNSEVLVLSREVIDYLEGRLI